MLKLFSFIFLILANYNLGSQILSTRNLIVIPEIDTNSTGELFNDFLFGAEFAKGKGSYGGEMDWLYKMHGFVELYRISGNSVLSSLFSHELNCNPHNDISFNPRKAIWEENVSYFFMGSELGVMGGVFFRCKHDLDNTNPPNSETMVSSFVPTNRVITLSGVNSAILHRYKFRDFSFNQQLLAEYYNSAGDYREPFSNDSASWEDFIGSIRWSGSMNYVLGKVIDLRVFSSVNATFLNTDRASNYGIMNIDYRAEFGLVVKSRQNIVEFFIGFEKMFDETVFIYSSATHFWNIGVRIRNSVFK